MTALVSPRCAKHMKNQSACIIRNIYYLQDSWKQLRAVALNQAIIRLYEIVQDGVTYKTARNMNKNWNLKIFTFRIRKHLKADPIGRAV